MGSFIEARILQTPRWLGGAKGYAYQEAQGAIQDEELALAKVALKARWPSPIGPVDALPWQAADRWILPAPGESDTLFAARLTNAPELWYWGGTKSGLANIFAPFAPTGTDTPPIGIATRLDRVQDAALINARRDRGESTPEIIQVHQEGVSTFAYFYSNWEWAGFWFGADWFSLVYGIIDSTAGPWVADLGWDTAGDWDDGGLWDCTMTEAEAKYIRLMIRRMKPHQAYPVTIALAMRDDELWDMPDDWDDGGNWLDSDPPIYIAIGHVWGEEEWLGTGLVDLWDSDDSTWDDFVDPLEV